MIEENGDHGENEKRRVGRMLMVVVVGGVSETSSRAGTTLQERKKWIGDDGRKEK